jgi:branched-subunit amino acid transport protein
MTIWLVMLIGGLLTYAIRLSFIALYGRMQVPGLVQRALRYIPSAVLSAIILPEVVLKTGRLDVASNNPRLLAALIAGLVAWRTRNALLTIVAGMAALWILKALLGA